ncbi:hypothetical protein CR513_27491, partial [Mucuna pruriens]
MRRSLGGEKKSLALRGKRGDMRNLVKNVKGGTLSHLIEKKWRSSRDPLWMHSSVMFPIIEWWNQFCREIREGRRRHVDTWVDLKRELRSKFVPTSYARDLYSKLQRMYQGSKSVEEYHKGMEVVLMRANVIESNEGTMTCFLHKLNRDIQDIAKLYHYATMDDLVHQATRVEAQQKRRLTPKRTYPSGLSN